MPVRHRSTTCLPASAAPSSSSWELDETDETRFGVVVRGAQAGGKDARVVSALRHLYTGYAPIRPGAHLIFKLMDAHIGRK